MRPADLLSGEPVQRALEDQMRQRDRRLQRIADHVIQVPVALEASAKLVGYYNEYFDTPYPLPKLDNVAGPGQSQFFSAMENWGAIFTF